MNIVEMADAGKRKLGAEDGLALARASQRIVAMKGKKRAQLDMRASPSDEEVLALLLGPTGNLRAPTMKVGTTLVVGFDPDVYAEIIGVGSKS